MTFEGFPKEAFAFYRDLDEDNSKEFWHAHKDTYDTCVRDPMQALAERLGDRFGPTKVWRPQRDVRFAKDKSPYKTYQGLTAGSADSVGYYLQLDGHGVHLGGGYHGLTSAQVERYREAVDADRSGRRLVEIVDGLRDDGWQIVGERLKTRPRGCPADHPRVELLRFRSLGAESYVKEGDRLHRASAEKVVRDGWSQVRRLVDWLDRHVQTGGK
ncbi:DUF2461 domain-containing protein [Micromonospora sp. NPDC000207]|uniref:DUF2461 domain-containing protein n=1 Tax=Micromonospora sp. NPDC000207 TaxID=3154246 RepID=UPI00332762CC